MEEGRGNTEFLFIGGGIAGLRAAIELSKRGSAVTQVTKSIVEDSNTYLCTGQYCCSRSQ